MLSPPWARGGSNSKEFNGAGDLGSKPGTLHQNQSRKKSETIKGKRKN